MRKFKKLLVAGCMSAALFGIVTGCGKKEAEALQSDAVETEYSDPETRETEYSDPETRETEYSDPETKETEYGNPETKETEYGDPEIKEAEKADTDWTTATDSETENSGGGAGQPKTEFICGTVEEIGNGSFTFQKRMIDDYDNIDLENMETQLITVKCTADTKYEHWTIYGGGADIDMEDAAFADITEGAGMEIRGYYEEDAFVAVRVVLEVYE